MREQLPRCVGLDPAIFDIDDSLELHFGHSAAHHPMELHGRLDHK